jgi:hypothetical protein
MVHVLMAGSSTVTTMAMGLVEAEVKVEGEAIMARTCRAATMLRQPIAVITMMAAKIGISTIGTQARAILCNTQRDMARLMAATSTTTITTVMQV